MDYVSILINLLISIVVAILASKLAVKGFYRQEIWLRKEEKYSRIIEHLNIVQKHYGDWMDEIIGAKNREGEDLETLKEYSKARRELELISQEGILVINKKVSEILGDLFKSSVNMNLNEQQGDSFGYTDRMHAETRDAKKEIIGIAKKDLRL